MKHKLADLKNKGKKIHPRNQATLSSTKSHHQNHTKRIEEQDREKQSHRCELQTKTKSTQNEKNKKII